MNIGELENYIRNAYNIIEQMAVTGQNQEFAVMAKSQLRKAIDIAKNEEDDGGK